MRKLGTLIIPLLIWLMGAAVNSLLERSDWCKSLWNSITEGKEILSNFSVGSNALCGFLVGSVMKLLWDYKPGYKSMWEGAMEGKDVILFIYELPNWWYDYYHLDEVSPSLEDKMTQLDSIKQDTEQELRSLEFQPNVKRKREVDNWLKNVEDKLEDVQKTVNLLEETCSSTWRRSIKCAWLSSCAKKQETDIQELIEQHRHFASDLVITTSWSHGRGYYLPISPLIGQVAEDKKKEILETLMHNPQTLLGIVGAQGMGKTTVVSHVYNNVLEVGASLFDQAFYVDVGRDSSICALQGHIAEVIGIQNLPSDELLRAAYINRAFNEFGKTLLILDGLTFRCGMDEIGLCGRRREDNETRNKLVVVVVSRDERVCRSMSCRALIKFPSSLPFSDSNMLFMNRLNLVTPLSSEIEQIAEEIVNRCPGVPSTIVDLATSMIGVYDFYEWREKLHQVVG